MAFPFIPVIIGTVLGSKFGPGLVDKVKGWFRKPDVTTMHLDPNLPDAYRKDAINILANVNNPDTLAKASQFYHSMGFTLTAQAIEAKLAALKG